VWPVDSPADGPLCLAVSGGPDSVAMLLLAHAAMPERIFAATVDHGLRPESAQEARDVTELCRSLGVEHRTLAVTVGKGNVQDRAREARYTALCHAFAERGVEVVATAHHADDQAETLLMRLNRGSGLSGLAGVRPSTWFGVYDEPVGEFTLVRPLLGWRRGELARVVADAGIEAAQDPSNEDDAFDRVRIRKAIADADWLDPLAMARSARHLAEAQHAMEVYRDSVIGDFVHREDDAIWFDYGHPQVVQIAVVEHILRTFGAEPRGSAVARMIASLEKTGTATLGGVIARRAWRQRSPTVTSDSWKFEREPPRSSG